MSKAILPFEEVDALLSYEASTGEIRWKVRVAQNVFAGDLAGTISQSGYRVLNIKKRQYKASRIAWLLFYKCWPTGVVDHINHITTDNRICNLRDVSQSENIQNQVRPSSRSSSGYLGVYKTKNRWVARITANGDRYFLGCFASPEIASKAYLEAKRELHI